MTRSLSKGWSVGPLVVLLDASGFDKHLDAFVGFSDVAIDRPDAHIQVRQLGADHAGGRLHSFCF